MAGIKSSIHNRLCVWGGVPVSTYVCRSVKAGSQPECPPLLFSALVLESWSLTGPTV